MIKILKILVWLKVIGQRMKNIKKHIKQNKTTDTKELKVGSIKDSFLKADISTLGTKVVISIDGFINEFEALLWAKTQTEIWLKAKETDDLIKDFNTRTLH